MCRLLAYAAPQETTVSGVIGATRAEDFQHMTRVHSDGWGSAWLAAGPGEERAELESLRISTPGQGDPLLTTILDETSAPARIVHLRLATDRFKRTKVNTHPFVVDGVAFAHNGNIVPVDRFDGLLDPVARAGVTGETDSELYFALVRQHARRLGSLQAGLVEAVRVLREVYPKASLNATLLTEQELLVVRASSTARVTEESFREVGVRLDDLPIEHLSDYYRLAMRRHADGTTVFSSTGIDQEGWTEVPDDTVSRVDLQTLQLTQRAVFQQVAVFRDASSDAVLVGATVNGVHPAARRLAAPVDLAEHRARRTAVVG